MQRLQQIEPISAIQTQPTVILAKLASGPVILAQRSRPAAVLVSVEQWDATADELEMYRKERRFTKREVEALLAAKEMELRSGPTLSSEELTAKLKERYPHVADQI